MRRRSIHSALAASRVCEPLSPRKKELHLKPRRPFSDGVGSDDGKELTSAVASLPLTTNCEGEDRVDLLDVAEETLRNLGLPPNRTQGQQGFLTYETDGRLPKAPPAGHSNPTSIL